MIIEITQNPHSFIVFLTVSMGLGYAFFRRPGFGIGKLFILLFLGGTLFFTAYERNHIVDVGLGILIGFLHAKEMLGLINPLTWFSRLFKHYRWNMQNRKYAGDEARAQANTNQQYKNSHEQETRKRQEQARQDREQANRKSSGSKQNKSSGSNDSYQSRKNNSSSNGYEQYKENFQKPKPKRKTEREKAFEVLGLEPTASMEEAKRARNKLMSLYHPDKLAGLPEGRRKKAEEEAKDINLAWRVLKKTDQNN